MDLPTSYTSFYAGANPVGYSTTKERINILLKAIEGYIDSFGDAETSAKFKAAIPSIVAYVEKSIGIAQAANTPAAVQPVSDADFAAYREKQNKIFATSGDLSALLSNLKF